ncbi:right-handed parallel beta-helix repeat-containing protein [Erythrobacter sp. SD-21]|uniref:right-handed parallel beta-helix repeat-containing protein n=1 Tax=Erythrobacter sp. SD-21 TaxID=161528 RepID=UPI0003144DAB|nr:right-handed parallel beta-helix repeat-containing protein [Erythrobacter sp. SD-21]
MGFCTTDMRQQFGGDHLGAAFLLSLCCLFLPGCAQAQANPEVQATTVVTVASLDELTDHLNARRVPERIALAPGRYETLSLSNREFSSEVTLTSADANSPAILDGLKLRAVNNLTISNIAVRPSNDSGGAGRYGMLVLESSNIIIDGVAFVGPGAEISRHYVAGLMLRESVGLTVRRSYFRNFRHGMAMLEVTKTRIVLNEFEGLQTDAIRGGGVADLLIQNNVMTDFRPAEGDHPDGIQLWSTRQKKPGRNIVIEGNLVARGQGSPTQGVFIRDTKLQLPFEKVAIRNNLVLGSLYNGIAVTGAVGVVVEDNSVYSTSDRKSWIRLQSVAQAVSRDNTALQFIYRDNADPVLDEGNAINQPVDVAQPSIIRNWVANVSGFSEYQGPVLGRLLAKGR